MARGGRVKSFFGGVFLLAGWIVLLLVTVIWLAWGLIQTEAGKDYLAAEITRLASTEEQKVELTGLDGALPFDIRLRRLRLSDRQGTWLEGESLHVTFSLVELQNRRLVLPLVRADRLAVSRPGPETSDRETRPKEERPPEKLPPVVVKDLAVNRLELLPPLSPTPRSFSLTSSARTGGDEVRARLEAHNLDRPADRLDLDAFWRGGPKTLELSLSLAEEPGGALAELAGLPPELGLNLTLDGKGPLSDWSGRLTAALGPDNSLLAELNLAAGPETRLTAKGDFLAGLLPDEADRFVGRQGRFSFDFRVDPGQTQPVLHLDALNLETPKVKVGLQATVDLAEEKISAGYKIEVLDPQPLAEAAGLTLTSPGPLTGRIEGGFENPTLTLKTSLGPASYNGFALRDLIVDVEARSARPLYQGIAAKGSLRIEGPSLAGRTEFPDRAEISFDITSPDYLVWDVAALKADTDWLVAETSGRFDAETLDLDGKIKLTGVDLSRAGGAAGLGLAGRAGLEAAVTGNIRTGRYDLNASGRVEGLGGLPQEALVLFGPNLDFSARAGLVPGRIEAAELTVRGKSGLKASGGVGLDPGDLDLTFALDLGGLPALVKAYGLETGPGAKLTGRVNGTFDNLALDAEGAVKQVKSAWLDLSGLTVSASLSGLPGRPAGRVDLTALAGKDRLEAGGDLAVSESRLRLQDLELLGPGAELSGSLDVDLKTGLMTGKVDLDAEDLGELDRFFGLGLDGSAEAEAALKPAGQDQGIDLAVWGHGLRLGGFKAGEVDFKARLDRLSPTPVGRVEAVIEDLVQGTTQLTRTSLKYKGNADRGEFHLETKGALDHPFNLTADGSTLRRERGVSLKLTALNGKYGRVPFGLEQAAGLVVDGPSYRLEGLDLKIGTGRVLGQGAFEPGRVAARIELEALPLTLLNLFSSPNLSGQVDGRVTLSGSPAAPLAAADLKISNFNAGWDQTAAPAGVSADVTAKVGGGQLSARADIRGFGPEPAVAELLWPLELSLEPFRAEIPAQRAVRGSAAGSLELKMAPALAGLDDQKFSGRAVFDVRLAGTPSDLRPSGSVEVKGGGYENVATGTILRDLNLKVTADQNRFTLVEATATDGSKGRVRATGEFVLGGPSGYSFQLDANLNQAALVRLDLYTAQISGDIGLKGDKKGMSLKGELSVDPSTLTIPKSVAGGVTELDVKEINRPGGDDETPVAKNVSQGGLGLDVKVIIPARFFVRGRGLELEWKGNLHVTGRSSNPAVEGELSVVRGRFDLLGRRFRLTEGLLYFSGATPPDPLVDVTGEVTIKGFTAEVHVTGPAASPALALESDPPLPRDEILARVLFGRELSSISPWQAVQLAMAARELAGGGGGLDIMGRAKKTLGVDQIEVSQSEEGDTRVGVGKYLTDNIYVEAERGTGQNTETLSVEIEITPNLSLETEVGSSAEGGLGLNWKIDY